MAISLSKGGNVSLSKEAPGLDRIMVGLGWDVRATDGQDFDLDASAFVCNAEGKVRSLLDNTGSPQDAAGVAQYLALVRKAEHVDGTLGMMAQWRIDRLMARAPQLTARTLLLATAGDRIVPPRVSKQAAAMLPRADYLELPDLGHLAHEDHAEAVVQAITGWLAR
ncbi:MAG: alpha/beta fold hydrolase [Rhodobacterales bacterium]|nr:MAG: alpha/beta fold hydrolase [Rhodobacterales bacterium]